MQAQSPEAHVPKAPQVGLEQHTLSTQLPLRHSWGELHPAPFAPFSWQAPETQSCVLVQGQSVAQLSQFSICGWHVPSPHEIPVLLDATVVATELALLDA
jgi:hypothetical protein